MSEPSTLECDADIVTFCVGGEQFQVLERVVRAKPDTLLCTLLDDPARQDKSKSIYVDANPKRFQYILDWYRYGSIRIPTSISRAEMERELAFFQVPEDATVDFDSPAAALQQAKASYEGMMDELATSVWEAKCKAIGLEIVHHLMEEYGSDLLKRWQANCTVKLSGSVNRGPWEPHRLSFWALDGNKVLGAATEAAEKYGFRLEAVYKPHGSSGWDASGGTYHFALQPKEGKNVEEEKEEEELEFDLFG